MTQYDKGVLKRFSIVVAILTAVGCLIGLIIFPPLAVVLLIGGIMLWAIVAFIIVVFGYIFNGQ